jgi:hypothetical protein
MPLKHEKFVDKVRKANANHLEDGERVEHAVGGQTGPVHSTPVLALVDVGRRFSGNLQSRLVVLTDRNLYVAYPGFFGQFEMKETKAKYPRGDAGAQISALPRGTALDVNQERIHFNLGTMKHVTNLVEAVGPQASNAAG